MRKAVLEALGETELIRVFGATTFQRGAAYARQGRVQSVAVDAEGEHIAGSVLGQGGTYAVVLTVKEVHRAGGRRGVLFGQCTCPVGADCKHAAALALVARRRLAEGPVPSVAPWERSLSRLVTRAAEDDRPATPLALQFEVVRPGQGASATGPRARAAGPRVRLRPVVTGASGGWVRTGVTWSNLGYATVGDHRDARQREALFSLYVAHSAAVRSPYGYSERPVHLDEFGPSIWRLLDDLQAAGVRLVPARGAAGPVHVVPVPAELSLDLSRAPDGGALLTPRIAVEGAPLPAGEVTFIGYEVHGLFLEPVWGRGPGSGDAGGGRGGGQLIALPGTGPIADPVAGLWRPGAGLVLARLREPASAEVSEALRQGEPVRIPARDVDRFLREYYPGLRQVVTVTSADGSVELPEVAPPGLVLQVEHHPGHRLTLEWLVEYPVGGQVRRVPLAGTSSSVAEVTARDRRAEAELVAALPLASPEFDSLVVDGESRRLIPRLEPAGLAAARFVAEVLPLLRRAGVRVEEVGEPAAYRFAEAAPSITVTVTDSTERDWFDLGVTVLVDGEDVPFGDLFRALALEESHLLLASGAYISIEREEYESLRRLIHEARALADRPGPPRINRYQVGLWEDLSDLGDVAVASENWRRTVAALAEWDGQVAATPLPADLRAELRPYQTDGYRWLSFLWEHDLGGVLADDMGLGKTLQVLAVIARAKEEGGLTDPVLVIAPTSVVHGWVREAARFTPGLVVASVGETETRRGSPLRAVVAGADVLVTSYALFRLEFEEYAALPWRALVLDEAQFVKNHRAKTYQCVRDLAAPVKLAITGTPLENSLMDLWAMLSIAAPGLFPNSTRFVEDYRNPIERSGDAEALTRLRRRIRPLMRRRTKEQVAADLPPKTEQVLDVELSPRHRTLYDTYLQRERQKVLGLLDSFDRNRIEILRSITLLRQLSLDPALVDPKYERVGSAKIDVLLENLAEVVEGGHRALVFSQFTTYLRRVRDRLTADGIGHVYLDGRTRDREGRISEFRSGSAPVFLISLKAGGFGLNLTEADYCFLLDPWWNPAVEAQAVDRTHRIGQDKNVMVYRLVSSGTVEEKVMALKARKQDLFDRVVGEEAFLSGPLTADDIRGLFE